jgi:8-oxo-dGTP pyrophosphatase MutT (NUDIX family)
MRGYVKELRKLIGTKPLLLYGASVLMFDPNGKVLMLLRTDNDCWCFPGGAVELGEKVEEAAKREALEETGLIIHEMELFGVFSGEELYYKYPHGDEVYIIDIAYKSSNYSGELVLDAESKKAEFFNVDHLPSNISPPTIPIAAELKKRQSIIDFVDKLEGQGV